MAMAKTMTPIICLLILALDIVAGVLGIEAELAQNKAKHVKVWIFECRDPNYQAFRLGLAAAVLMATVQAVANAFGGCICIWSKNELNKASPNQTLAAASLTSLHISIILALGFSMLMAGAIENSKSRRYCSLLHHHLLSIGGILCFIHGLLSVAYYASANAFAREKERNPSGASA